MIGKHQFYNYKKLIIFGPEGSGKTSLVQRIKKGTFTNEEHSEDGNIKINLIYIIIHRIYNKLYINWKWINSKLDLNIYEIRIDEDFINNIDLIDSFLLECHCVLFLFEITNQYNLLFIKQFLSNIDLNKYPYLKIILVPNKLELENERQIFNFDLKKVINKFLENKNSIDIQEISVKTGKNIQNLTEKIRMSLDNTKYNHSFNSISELNTKYIKNIALNNTRTLHFLLLGDKNAGKTVFLTDISTKILTILCSILLE